MKGGASMGAALATLLLTLSFNVAAQTTPGSADVEFEAVEPPKSTAPAERSPPTSDPEAEVLALIEAARTDDAILRCDRLLTTAVTATNTMRRLCAYALTAHGDRIYALGSLREAKLLWSRARTLNPALSVDPAMVLRSNLLGTGAALTPTPPPSSPKSVRKETAPAQAPRCPACPACPICPTPSVAELCPEPPTCAKTKAAEQPQELGPRADRGLGIGLGAGYDGLASLVVSWMHKEFLSLEASVGLLFPTLDARIRFFGTKTLVTPVFGVGMLTPFGDADHFDADIQAGFPELYGHGTAVHVDLGVSYAPWRVLDIYAGVSFMTTLDGEVEMLLFFPHWSVQTVFYF